MTDRRTCVFFHAHPDDEALYTSGTMAMLAAEGHRVVLVVATAGDRGLAAPEAVSAGSAAGSAAVSGAGQTLGDVRLNELEASTRALGCARVEFLGYADSGIEGDAGPTPDGREPFASADVEKAAEQLAAILTEEHADVLTVYDPSGGYGHADHRQVHAVGYRAAELAATPRVLESTVDRDRLLKLLRVVGRVYRFPPGFMAQQEGAYAAGAEITHQIDVRHYARAKRASLKAHATQASGGSSIRTLAALRMLPWPVFGWVLGTEWYVERDRTPGVRLGHVLEG
jgi:LmbE family N-acetylglucosaminyl deacetylase